MAAFSRGFGMGAGLGAGLGIGLSQRLLFLAPRTAPQSCAHQPTARVAAQAIRRSPIIQAARNLQTSSRFHAQKQTASSSSRAAMPKTSRTPSPSRATSPQASTTPSSPPTGTSSSVIQRLAARGKPTVLYQCPSHFWLYFSSFAAASFCITYAVIHYWSVVAFPPEGLAWWIPHGFAVICLFMGLFGVWFLYSSAFIVRRITAVPAALLPAAQLRAAAARAKGKAKSQGSGKTSAAEEATQLHANPITLECEVSSLLPFLQPKKVLAAPGEVLLPFKFAGLPMAKDAGKAVPPPPPPPPDGVIGRIAKPFEVLGRGVRGAFLGFRRGLLRQGFAPIKVKGMRYKVDVTGGKLFENGKVLDHIVAYRPERFQDSSWQEKMFII